MKMYRANYWNHDVVAYEYQKVTQKTITYHRPAQGRFSPECSKRENLESHRHKWFDTWQEAHDALVGRLIMKIEHNAATIVELRATLAELQAKRDPGDES